MHQPPLTFYIVAKVARRQSLGEWTKTCRYCEGHAAANLAKLVQWHQHHDVPTVS